MFSSECIEKLESCREMEKGWNGYTADPPDDKAIVNAIDFVKGIHNFSNSPTNKTLTPSRVAASADGGIGVTFRHNTEEVYVEFCNDGENWTMLCSTIDSNYETEVYKGLPDEVNVVNDKIELLIKEEVYEE